MKTKIGLALIVASIALVSILWAGDITPQGVSQGDLVTFLTNTVNAMNKFNATNYSKTGLASNTTTVGIGTCTYQIDGVMYYKASQTVTLTAAAQTALTSCRYLISLSSAGVATATKGTEVSDPNVTGNVTLTIPAVPDNYCPVGYIEVSTLAGFTLGTTNFGVSTSTFVDLSFIGQASHLSLTGL